MQEIYNKLRKLYREALKSEAKPTEFQIDRKTHHRLLDDPSCHIMMSYDFEKSKSWTFLGLPFVLVVPPLDYDFIPDASISQSGIAKDPPQILTVVAKSRIGRICYFNDPENPEEYR